MKGFGSRGWSVSLAIGFGLDFLSHIGEIYVIFRDTQVVVRSSQLFAMVKIKVKLSGRPNSV